MNKRIIAAALILTMLSGCVSMFGDSSDKITVHSNDPAATILVNGNEVGQGSVVYPLPRGKTAILTATKNGCADRSVPTDQSIDGLYWLNIFVWPGLVVDMATGAMKKADPTDYTVTPDCRKHA
ncbi:MAG: hypothetical protein WCD70_00535 [Alphaproteobacteria bacterium]